MTAPKYLTVDSVNEEDKEKNVDVAQHEPYFLKYILKKFGF